VPVGRLYEEYSSKEFRDLESYMLGLEAVPKWHSLGSLDGVDGFRMSRSKFSSEIPVIRYVIHFSPPIPAEFVLNMFGDPSFRTSWDSRVLQMNKIYLSEENHFLHYHIVHFNAPLQDRDFLTRYYMRKVGKETRVVLKSTKHKVGTRQEFPEVKDTVRAKTMMGMYRVIEGEEETTISMMMQINLYLALKAAEDMVPQFVLKWLAKYRAQTIEHYNR